MTVSLLYDIYSDVVVVIVRTFIECMSTMVFLCIHDIRHYLGVLASHMEMAKTAVVPVLEPIVLETVFWANRQWTYFSHSAQKHLAKYPRTQMVFYKLGEGYVYCIRIAKQIHDKLFIWYPEPSEEQWTRVSYILFGTVSSRPYTYYERAISFVFKQPYFGENVLDVYLGGGDCFQTLMCVFMNREYSEYFRENTVPISSSPSAELVYDVVSAQIENAVQHAETNTNMFVVSKINGVYTSRLYLPEELPTQEQFSLSSVRSRVRFLAIYYVHPEMKRPIPVVLPETIYYVDNHLLSATHVLQYLRQLPIYQKYAFDERYVLSILDHNVRRVSLHYNQYLVLGENEYHIRDL